MHHGLQVEADGEHRRGVDGGDAVPVQSLRFPHRLVVLYRADGRRDTVGLLGNRSIAGALSGVSDCLDLGASVAIVHVSGDARGGPPKNVTLHGWRLIAGVLDAPLENLYTNTVSDYYGTAKYQ